MASDHSIAFAAFTGSLALAGLGLGFVIQRDATRRRAAEDHASSVAEARRLMRAVALEDRLGRLEKLASAQREER